MGGVWATDSFLVTWLQVLDSPFSKLTDLMLELVEEQRLPIPRALYKMALGMMRRSVKKRAHFNIDTVSPIDVVQESYIPALFGELSHACLEARKAVFIAGCSAPFKLKVMVRGPFKSLYQGF